MKRLSKRAIIVALAVCLVLAMPFSVALASSDLPVTEGDAAKASVDVSWYTQSPHETEYLITTAAQLRGLSAIVNGTAVDEQGQPIAAQSFEGVTLYQTATINLSDTQYTALIPSGYTVYEWTPIGTQEHPFAGTFQATGGNTINGLYLTKTFQNAGLFGYCTSSSLLKNVSLSDGYGAAISLTTENEHIKAVGSLVGYTKGDVDGCSSSMTTTINSTGKKASTVEDPYVVRWIGGVAGYISGDLSNSSFGGLLDLKVDSDAANPDTSSDSLCVGATIGGIVGRFGDPDNHGTITGCHNEGTVYTRTTGAASADRFGTTTYSNLFFIGGVVGYSNGSIYNCSNGTFNEILKTTTGTVSTSATDKPDGTPNNNRGGDQVGGICGGLRSESEDPSKYNDGDPYDPMTVSNCFNVGHVTGSCATGGIVGQAGVYCTVTQCQNGVAGDTSQTAGKVISARWNKPISAGILGQARGSNVNYCANYAEIRNIQTGYYMAGICGALFVSDDYPDVVPELYACLNTGGIYTINTSSAVEYREAGLVGQNEGYIHDSLSMEGSVPYHGNALIGANDWGMWNNLEVWTSQELQTPEAAAFLNACAAQEQDWDTYWFINKSGYPTLNTWASLSESERTELTKDNIASIEEIESAPYVGGEGGSLPTLKVTLTNGKELVQNTDFCVIPQEGAVEISETPYLASISGLGMYRGTVKDCAQYHIGASVLEKGNVQVEAMSYNGGKVVFPTKLQARMGTSVIDAKEYNYVIYSRHVSATDVQTGATGNTVAFDSLGYISYTASGTDKVAVSTVSIAEINAETRPYWLWDRNGELISDSNGVVYYTTTSGGGTAGMPYGDNESCVSQRIGTPAGFVVQVFANDTSKVLTGNCIGSYEIKAIDLVRECTFSYVKVQGQTWYWDVDSQSFYTLDESGEPVYEMPCATFTGNEINPEATISCKLSDGSTYTLVEDVDFYVVSGDPDKEETYKNRNITNYTTEEKDRACMTIRPVDTSCFSNYIVGYFGVAPADFATCDVAISSDTWAYTGKEVEPEVTVSLNGVTLIEDLDYTVEYQNNIEKGEGKYIVTPLANLSAGGVTPYVGTFNIVDGTDLSTYTVEDIADQQFNYGYDVHPTLVFHNENGEVVELEEGVDYQVTYSTTNVTKAQGTNPDGKSIAFQSTRATATIEGIGLCKGTITKQFDIVPYDAATNTTNQLRATLQTLKSDEWKNLSGLPYNVGITNPVVNVYALPIVDWNAYAEGDFEKAYGSPVIIGNAANETYGATINNRPARYYVYDASAAGGLGTLVSCDGEDIPNPYETGSGTTLATQKAPADTALIATVAMRIGTSGDVRNGAVGLFKTGLFEVTSETPGNFIVDSIDDQEYTGSQIKPTVVVTESTGIVLTENVDYTLEYGENLNVGLGSVKVIGKGDYTGSLTKYFSITKASNSASYAQTSVVKSPQDASFTNPLTNVSGGVVSYSSSAETVASVNATTGEVTIKGGGTAVITADVAETANYTACQASYIVYVEAPSVEYRTHVQNIGWQDFVQNGEVAGTSGMAYRLEGIEIKIGGLESLSGGIEYRTHIQNIGWQDYKADGQMSGTSGMAYRLEAIDMHLTGDLANKYDVYYRVHAENIGWMGWAKNGEEAGTAGYAYRLEAIQIVLVEKGGAAPGDVESIHSVVDYAYVSESEGPSDPYRDELISYNTHVQNIGWQEYSKMSGMAGTSGLAYRLEGIHIKLGGAAAALNGSVEYRTHVQNIGWQTYVKDGEMSGTSGLAYRLEAINIRLTDEVADAYDIYYRVHAQNVGWMGWAKNGEASGTAGYAYRLEAIQIVMLPKGSDAPGKTYGDITSDVTEAYLEA